MSIKTDFVNNGSGFVAIVENVDGKRYVLTADTLNEVIDDWYGDCSFVPSNDARVYFAMFNNRPISPYDAHTFEGLMGYLQGYYGLSSRER